MNSASSSNPSDPAISGLGAGSLSLIKQQIEESREAFTVACAIEFASLDEYEDSRKSCNDEYNIQAHIRTLFLREIHGWGWTELHDFIKEEGRAETIGYDPKLFAEGKSAPSRTTISRAWHEYFGNQLKEDIDTLCKWVRSYAKATNNLIGDLMFEPEDRTGDSQRTQYRVKRKQAHEIAEEFRELFYSELDLDLPEEIGRAHV